MRPSSAVAAISARAWPRFGVVVHEPSASHDASPNASTEGNIGRLNLSKRILAAATPLLTNNGPSRAAAPSRRRIEVSEMSTMPVETLEFVLLLSGWVIALPAGARTADCFPPMASTHRRAARAYRRLTTTNGA